MNKIPFIPALKWKIFTPIYDLFIHFILPEKKCKSKLVKQCKLRPGQKILDLGCGTAKLTIMAWESEQNSHITGLDIDPQILEIAKKNLKKSIYALGDKSRSLEKAQQKSVSSLPSNVNNGQQASLDQSTGISLIEYNGQRIPFDAEHFDTIMICLVFHHLSDKDKIITLNEIYRVLKPGGWLHMADWGSGKNLIMKMCYFLIRLIDGFSTTRINAKGLLPILFCNAGFTESKETGHINTVMGSLCYYQGKKP